MPSNTPSGRWNKSTREQKQKEAYISSDVFLFSQNGIIRVQLGSQRLNMAVEQVLVSRFSKKSVVRSIFQCLYEIETDTYGLRTISLNTPTASGSNVVDSIDADCSNNAFATESVGMSFGSLSAYFASIYRQMARLSKRISPSSS